MLVEWAERAEPSGSLGPLAWFPLVTWTATLQEGKVVGRAEVHVRTER
jgi:hypothetical protein